MVERCMYLPSQTLVCIYIEQLHLESLIMSTQLVWVNVCSYKDPKETVYIK